jgi:hypothetical protein
MVRILPLILTVKQPWQRISLKSTWNKKSILRSTGKKWKIKYLGKEYENDMLVFYIEVTGVSNVKNVLVRNSVLMDLFEEQKNLVHVKVKGKTKSMVLVSGREENTLNF